MKEIRWLNEREFMIEDVAFYCALADYSVKTNPERFVILKDRQVLSNYAAVFADTAPRTLLKFGIFQGGSPALFSLWFDVEKFVGVDISARVAAFDDFCRTHKAGKRSVRTMEFADRSAVRRRNRELEVNRCDP